MQREHRHGPPPRYDVRADLRVQELLDAVRASGAPGDVAERLESLFGSAGLELQRLRECRQAVRETRDMLTDHFADHEGTDGVRAIVATIRAELDEDLDDAD